MGSAVRGRSAFAVLGVFMLTAGTAETVLGAEGGAAVGVAAVETAWPARVLEPQLDAAGRAAADPSLRLDEVLDELIPIRDLNRVIAAFNILPGGSHVLLGDQDGTIRIADPATGQMTVYYELPNVATYTEKGLLDIEFSPTFAADRHVYLYYTPACADDPGFSDPVHEMGCADWSGASCGTGTDADADAAIAFACPVACGRCSDDGDLGISVVRYTQIGAGLQSRLDPASLYVVWQDRYGYRADQEVHHGGQISFGPDGCIYASIGDKTQQGNVQKMWRTNGKIIRFRPDGTFPNDNIGVLSDGVGGRNYDGIYALGFRNPYRATWDLESGQFLVANVGANNHGLSYEDLYSVRPGDNMGWPHCDGGPCVPDAETDNPCGCHFRSGRVFGYHHGGSDAAIIGGFVYRGNMFPAVFNGAYVFGDYAKDFVGVVWLGNGTGGQGQQLTEPRTAILSSRAGMRPTALRQAFDGSIYYISRQNADRFGGSTLRRITFAGDHGGQSGVTTDAPVDGNDDSTPTVATGSTSSSALAVYPGTGSAGSEGSGDEGEDDTPYPGLALVEALEHIYVDPGVGEAPLTVYFDIGWHLVPDDAKDVLETDCSFNWGFGDYHADGPLDRSVVNQPSSVGVHEYTAAGVFAAHVTVVCNDITFVSSSASIQVVDEPADEFLAMAIGTPSNNDVFVAGTTIMLTVDDGDSASNPDREIEWHIELQHSGHTHPITRLTGHAVSFSVPTQGHGFPNDSYLVIFLVDVASGTLLDTVQLYPEREVLQIQSPWSSATSLTVDGGPQPLPYTLTSVIGFVHRLSVPSEICFEWHGIKSFARFERWKDGPAHHTRMMPVPATGGQVQFNYTGRSDLSCSGRAVPVVDGFERVCDQPGWQAKRRETVCFSSIRTSNECNRAVTWSRAADVCLATGGRLCTADELRRNAARGGGCNLNQSPVWAEDACGPTPGHRLLVPGSRAGRNSVPEQCTPTEAPAGQPLALAGVKCCAGFDDRVPTMSSSGGDATTPASISITAPATVSTTSAVVVTTGPTLATAPATDGLGTNLIAETSTSEPTPAPTPSEPTSSPTSPTLSDSFRPCEQIRWNSAANLPVCSGSFVNGVCYRAETHANAAQICASIGARLCRAAELQANLARSTGCAMNKVMVWTSNRCGGTAALQAPGAGTKLAPVCISVESDAAVRCCADRQ